MDIRLENVVKTFQTFRAVRDVSLEIRSGELVALLGPSGSGKTTILRMIAGLEYPDGGRILFGDRDATNIAVGDRGVGFVFQNYALFPHMTVAENIGFGIRVSRTRKRPREQLDARVKELLQLMRLDGLGDRFPGQVSGGQRQRVALARALAVDPTVLLLDEPFGALDANVRRDLRRWLREIHDELHITTLFVTHDQEEALDLADRVVILNEGRIVQEGTPEAVSRTPRSRFVMTFLGDTNRLPAFVRNGTALVGSATEGEAPVQAASLQVPAPDVTDGPAEFLARPRDLAWDFEGPGLAARIGRIIDRPDGRRLVVTTDTRESLELDVPPELPGRVGDRGFVTIRRGQVFGVDRPA